MSQNHKRDYERFLNHSERAGRALRENPDFFKTKVGGARLSPATRERVRVFIHDINHDPLRPGKKIRGLDHLINRLIDEHNRRDTIDSPILKALHTEGEKAGQRQNQKVEGVS